MSTIGVIKLVGSSAILLCLMSTGLRAQEQAATENSVVAVQSGVAEESQGDRVVSNAVKEQIIYVDIPAGNPISNAMMVPFMDEAVWMRSIKSYMAIGVERPFSLMIGSSSDMIARKAVQSALKSFDGRQLPYLTLTLVGDTKKAESLRKQAEALGITFQVEPASFRNQLP